MTMPDVAQPPRWFVLAVWSTVAALSGIIGFTAAAGLVDRMPVATVTGLVTAAGAVAWLRRQPGVSAAIAGAPRRHRGVFAVGALLLVGQLIFATAFVIDPTFTRWEPRPWLPHRSSHSCVSAYWIACASVARMPAIYDQALYDLPKPDPASPRRPRTLGPLAVDHYEYPPAFLAVPRLIATVTPDFWAFRRVWFALMLGVTTVGIVAVARRLDGATGSIATWLTPYVLVAPAMVMTLTIGNVQLATIAASLLAMLAFERRRYPAGAALLAYATLSKLYPAVLLFYLLLRRDWRALGWTAAWAGVILLVTIADFGTAPYLAFATELPSLLGGEAFSALRNPIAVAVNESIPGIPLKLGLFGVPYMGFTASKIIGWTYTAVVLAVIARLALRPADPRLAPLVWLIIVILATLRSPFVASYAPFPSLWLATLLAGLTWGRSRVCVTAVAMWLVLAFSFGVGGAAPAVNAIWTFAHTIAAFALVVQAVRLVAPARAPVSSPIPSEAPASA
jgi:hypothetical protein